jgi:sugar/nucleoside kinase (ribokinase family)
MKITTIGSGLVDIYIRSADFAVRHQGDSILLCQAFGLKLEIDDCVITSGGGATNTAVGFARQGHQVSCVIETGQDVFAKQIKADLRAEKIDLSQIVSEVGERTGFSVALVGSNGQRAIMVNRGASALLDAKDIDLDYLSHRHHLHLTSVGGRKAALRQLWHVFTTDKQPSFSWNPGKKELELLRSGELKLPATQQGIFIVNQEEWRLVTGLHDLIKERFWLVVVTAGGGRGQFLSQRQTPYH